MAEKTTDKEDKIIEKLAKSKETAFHRFPLLFTMLAAFGLVIMNGGIQRVVDKMDWLDRNPLVMLAVGILILLFTGTLYKKL